MRERLKYWWTAIYLPLYFACFTYLERRDVPVTIIGLPIDYKIPFIDAFIIPYLLWFPFMGLAFVGIFWFCKKEYAKMAIFLMTGMTIFLIVSYIWPNGLNLRPDSVSDSIFAPLLKNLYSGDTSTNVFPSLHVFNSIGAAIAFWRVGSEFNKKWIGVSSIILAVLIILSTMFIKQHSVIDVIGAFVMAAILYLFVYWLPERKISKQ